MANWEGINEFVAVAELENFSKAARRLGISTAQVSRQVSKLENRLGSKLLNRTTRVVALTDTGQTFYRHCKPILEELFAAEQVVTDLQAKPSGKLVMTAPVTYGERIIAPVINDIAEAYPELEFQLHLTNQLVDLIHDGYDLAVRLGTLEDSSYIARKLSSRAWHLVASSEYINKFGMPHTVSELSQHQCILGTSDSWKFTREGKTELLRVKARLRCNSGVALVDAALKGLGIVQLPDYYVEGYLSSGQLIEVMPGYQVADEGIWAIYPATRHLSPKVRLVIDALVAALN